MQARSRPKRPRRRRARGRFQRARPALASLPPGRRPRDRRPPRARRPIPSRARRSFRHRDRLVALEQAEAVALRVLAAGEPPDAGNRLLVVALAAELPHLGEIGVDVVAAEIDRGAGGAFHLREDRAAPAVLLEHPVVDARHARVPDRPTADGLPELLCAVGVLRRKLDVYDLLSHLILLSG